MKDKVLRQALKDGGIIYGTNYPEVQRRFNEPEPNTVSVKTGRVIGKPFGVSSLGGFVGEETISLPLGKAIEMIIDHLGLELDYQPEQKEEIKGFKKKRKNRARPKA